MYKVRDILYEYATPEQIPMSITTNGSRVSIEELATFNRFKQLHSIQVLIVLDPMFEYMRSAGIFKWDQMNKLIGELAEFKQKNKDWLLVKLRINSTMLYNSLLKSFLNTHITP